MPENGEPGQIVWMLKLCGDMRLPSQNMRWTSCFVVFMLRSVSIQHNKQEDDLFGAWCLEYDHMQERQRKSNSTVGVLWDFCAKSHVFFWISGFKWICSHWKMLFGYAFKHYYDSTLALSTPAKKNCSLGVSGCEMGLAAWPTKFITRVWCPKISDPSRFLVGLMIEKYPWNLLTS